MKVALIHDWLTGMRGGERVLEVFCELFPDATLFTLLHVPGSTSPTIERMRIHTSFVQKLPRAAQIYRYYLPLFPKAIESFDLCDYDFVLSVSHCVAKGARPKGNVPHVCYCNTPMRYVWDLFEDYFGPRAHLAGGGLTRWAAKRIARRLRRWDVRTCERVTHFVANSRHVADRIRRHYDRDSTVIYPPVDCSRFPAPTRHWRKGAYYLVLSALAPYKRIDLAVQAADRMKYPLWVVGAGQHERRLRAMSGPRVKWLGQGSDTQVPGYYAGCRALIFPGEEDFGIVPLEAMASGRPVVAFGKGGALETVADTAGVLFPEQTVESLVAGIDRLEAEADRYDPAVIRAHAFKFDRPVFKERTRSYIFDNVLAARGHKGAVS